MDWKLRSSTTRGSWLDGTVLCERSQTGNNNDYGDSSTLSTPYNVSSSSSRSSIPEPGPVAGNMANRVGTGNIVTHHARAFRVEAARSAPCSPSVAHKSTRWTVTAVTLHPIVLSCRSWRSAQRTWVPSINTLSIRDVRNPLYCHIELLGPVVSLRNQKSDVQYQSALVMLRGTTCDSLFEEFITPGVHLQESGKSYAIV